MYLRSLKLKYSIALLSFFFPTDVYSNSQYMYVTQEETYFECYFCQDYSFTYEEDLSQRIDKIWNSHFYEAKNYLEYFKTALEFSVINVENLSPIEQIVVKFLNENEQNVKDIFYSESINKKLQFKRICSFRSELKNILPNISDNIYFDIFFPYKKLKKSAEFYKFYEMLHPSAQTVVDYLLQSISGILKSEEISPGYLERLENESLFLGYGSVLELGFQLSSASPKFIMELLKYAHMKHLPLKDIAALSRFKDGGSVFLSQNSYRLFVLSGKNLLGRGGVLFVTSKSIGDKILKGRNPSEIEYILGLEEGTFKSGIVKYELPFSFDYEPVLPNNKTVGKNKYFNLGGFTSGRVPELIFNNVSKNDIIKVEYFRE